MRKSPFHSVFIIAIGFSVIYLFSGQVFWFFLAHFIGILGMIHISLARKIERWWFKLGDLLGLVVPKILLTLLFYLVLTPLAFLARLFQRESPLHMKNDRDSTWIAHDRAFDQGYFEKTW